MAIPKRYKCISSIGEGYFAHVARYKDAETGAEVAIKRLKQDHVENDDSIRRFRKEVELLEQLDDVDGVMELLGVIDEDDELAYVMPLGSRHLYSYIKVNNTSLDLPARIDIFDQILQTMRKAHEAGVLHRDVSPQNVIVFDSENEVEIRVCDFGLGKSVDAVSAYTKTSVGGFGHADYVAPEQRASLKRATVHSDIHAMGKLLNFVMTGKDPDRHYPCEFSVVIQKATQTDPDDRYQSLAEFEEVYEKIKELHFGEHADEGDLVLADLDVDDEVNWHAFHESVTNPNDEGHVYYSYIKPVIGHLLNGCHLEEYYEVVGDDIAKFVQTLISRINDCIGTVGWPFSATGSFGRMLERVMLLVADQGVQTACACELWDIAYGGDQWDVQRIVESLFRENQLPKGIETSVALHIREAGISVDSERFSGMALPQVIRNAIALLEQ